MEDEGKTGGFRGFLSSIGRMLGAKDDSIEGCESEPTEGSEGCEGCESEPTEGSEGCEGCESEPTEGSEGCEGCSS